MPRWMPDARRRLVEAATELIAAQGLPATSMGQVARRAGLTRSTVHRHFADKRTLLDAVQEPVLADVRAGVRAVPAGAAPLDLVEAGMLALVTGRGGRATVAVRAAIALAEPAAEAATPARDGLGAALIGAMTDRGVDPQVATVAAMTGTLALDRAVAPTSGESVEDRLRDELDALRDACGALV